MAHGGLLVLIVFVLLLSASGLGMYLHGRLGERHRTSETVDHVRLVVSILVTFTALVLSLLLSEVKGTFDTFDARLRAFAGDLVNLDIHLREYGPDAEPAIIRDSPKRRTSSASNSAPFSSKLTSQFTNLTRRTISANGLPTHWQIRSMKRCTPGVSCSRRRMIRFRGR
jgi:hypothetical protein